jgi:hypothetical protein
VRAAFPVKKVTSSNAKGQPVILTKDFFEKYQQEMKIDDDQ